MKDKKWYALALAAALLACASGASQQTAMQKTAATAQKSASIVDHPSKLSFDSLNWKVPLGDPYRSKLKGGAIAYIAVDSSLPLVKINANIRCGSLSDPVEKDGLGTLMANLLRTGGTEKYPADSLDKLLDLLAMKFSFSQTESHVAFQATFLSDYLDTALDVMNQMFFHPAFQPEKLEKEKSLLEESIRHRFVNPGPILGAAYKKLMYPQSAPSHFASLESVRSVTRDDLVNLHKEVFTGKNIVLSASGKFDRKKLSDNLNKMFSGSKSKKEQIVPSISIRPSLNALIVHKPISQAYIRMGMPLFKRPNPDYYAVSVLNVILGGSGFTSRLTTKVRSDEGLTYSIYSNSESNYVYPGTFYIDFYTKTESYSRAIAIVLQELKKVREEGVTEQELENAKSMLISELPSMFRSPDDIVSTYAWNEFFGRTPDHYAKYPAAIRALTREDIKAAAQKYLDLSKLTFTIVGDTTALFKVPSSGAFSLDSLKNRKIVSTDSLALMP